MTVDIKIDERFKVTPQIVKEMEILRKQGFSFKRIGKMFNLSCLTAQYWTDEVYREKQRKKNAKHKNTSKARISQKLKQNDKFMIEYALGYISKRLDSAKYNGKDEKILGMSWKHWDDYLEKNWRRGKIKIK